MLGPIPGIDGFSRSRPRDPSSYSRIFFSSAASCSSVDLILGFMTPIIWQGHYLWAMTSSAARIFAYFGCGGKYPMLIGFIADVIPVCPRTLRPALDSFYVQAQRSEILHYRLAWVNGRESRAFLRLLFMVKMGNVIFFGRFRWSGRCLRLDFRHFFRCDLRFFRGLCVFGL
jgi:hypothetical protein